MRLCVVVAAQGTLSNVTRCLDAFEAQRHEGISQVVLVLAGASSVADAVLRKFPCVEVVRQPAKALVPELWAEGVLRSREAVVALTTAEMLAEPGWAAALVSRFEGGPWAGIGGAILPGPNLGPTDTAIYWLRYHRFATRPTLSAVADIAGDNGSYRRQTLGPYLERIGREGFWEYELNQDLVAAGNQLCLEPEATVRYQGGESFSVFARQRLTHGRRFGLQRFESAGMLGRWLLLAAWPITPAAMLARIARAAQLAGALGRLAPGLPALVSLIACWSGGELLGYLHGVTHSERPSPLAVRTAGADYYLKDDPC